MFSRKNYSLIALGGFVIAALTVSFFLRETIFGRSAAAPVASVGAPVKSAANRESDSDSAAKFKDAAAANATFKKNLKWTFGSKPQTGWHLYVPLIQRLLETEAAPESTEFAAALARWQATSDLRPNGVLETETLSAMIKYWQSRRLNSSVYPAADEVLTAPIEDFFDPGRGVELLKVRRDAFAAYKAMVAAARADKSLNLKDGTSFLKIVSAFRSKEYQDELRRRSPHAGRAALAVNSPHFTGRALDIYVGGEPVSTRDENRAVQIETPAYKWLVKNAERFGFRPYYYEPWHWEYVPEGN